MSKRLYNTIIVLVLFLTACGPETIFVRPSLDTPERHIANGRALFAQGKTHHALREFNRAHELDPYNLDALIGLAVTTGHCGDVDKGLIILKRAEEVAATEEEKQKVQEGYGEIEKLRGAQ